MHPQPPHSPTLTCLAQDFLEQLVTLGLGAVQKENLFLFGKDIVGVHLPSQRSDCRQHFQVRQLVPKSTSLPGISPSEGAPFREAGGGLPHGGHLPYRAPLLKFWSHGNTMVGTCPLRDGERDGGCPYVQQ